MSICPSSHKTTPFLLERPLIIKGKEGTTILFNCDIIHSGAINEFGENIEDKNKLNHLIGINKTTNGKCKNNWLYEYVFHIFTKILQNKPNENSIILE